ncbi:hypothetical protein SAMN04489761_0271 [Tenacibaculum sp. MAR_2009_124]|uniref:hypothetical protein n=1 Tax=Tenacibaculum sp. MAR_2009_124 TaxID=1250059 RepID=UPI00089BB0A9|nr:hypothetical protein [Tenacibaculum sp. MAR_2009_124]SEB37644.1 hypothetical protein SAMN04489761_0271 [Tenacibaculum sp. MAR_2009_124]
MKNKELSKRLALILIFWANISFSQSSKLNIVSGNTKEVKYLKMDDFYLTHYLYIDLFLREGLYLDADEKEVSSMLKSIKKYVSDKTPIEFEIEKPSKRNYKVRVTTFKKDENTELLIAFTNWSVKRKEFEKDIKMKNNSYTRWYFLNGDKMTYRKDMSRENDYSTMSKIDLANAYLFDELSDNDSEIEGILLSELKNQELSLRDKIMANLILLKYQIFKRDNSNVFKQVEYLETLFEEIKSDMRLRGLKEAFRVTKFQIELMK